MALGTGHTKLTFAVSSQGYTYGLDARGKIRWYSTNKISHIFKRLSNHHLLILTKISPMSISTMPCEKPTFTVVSTGNITSVASFPPGKTPIN
ncbi:aryl-sulfate sulfotransferase [Levilactobacillus brevis]|nr:aryl-sulfate sulfotransferase [Levilactobacillus brevis]